MVTTVRAFALSLVVLGGYASIHTSSAPVELTARTSAMPIPSCPPDGTNGCGIWGSNRPK